MFRTDQFSRIFFVVSELNFCYTTLEDQFSRKSVNLNKNFQYPRFLIPKNILVVLMRACSEYFPIKCKGLRRKPTIFFLTNIHPDNHSYLPLFTDFFPFDIRIISEDDEPSDGDVKDQHPYQILGLFHPSFSEKYLQNCKFGHFVE